SQEVWGLGTVPSSSTKSTTYAYFGESLAASIRLTKRSKTARISSDDGAKWKSARRARTWSRTMLSNIPMRAEVNAAGEIFPAAGELGIRLATTCSTAALNRR